MLISDANKGFSGRKRRVGAMRGLISLAVIFFVALSAQASAKTFLRCQGESLNFFPNGPENEVQSNFYVSYDVGKGSKVKNLKVSQFKCDPFSKIYSDETKIIMHCSIKGDIVENKLEIDRISGIFLGTVRFDPPRGEGSTEALGFWTVGSCKKVKQKF